MLPSNRLDIGWSDLLHGLACCFCRGSHETVRRRVEEFWSATETVACLSVRSGFDSLLEALALPPGSEVLVSAVTVRDMVRIIEEHGLVAVPVDLHMETLSLDPESLRGAVGPRTRAILVAHLFGSRLPLGEVAALAREHGLYLIEDCAQAYVGSGYRGDSQSDACMFSFGPIKTNTALGGAVLRIRDARHLAAVGAIQARLPVQSRWRFLQRLAKYSVLKLLAQPQAFGVFAAVCGFLGKNYDEVINAAVRGFPGAEFFAKIRQQPSYPLLALLERKLKRFRPGAIDERVAVARAAMVLLPELVRPGAEAPHHSYWVFPILTETPDALMHHLWARGFNATRGASSLCVVASPPDRLHLAPARAEGAMRQILYLPVYPGVSPGALNELARAIHDFQRRNERRSMPDLQASESTSLPAPRAAPRLDALRDRVLPR